MPDTGFNWEDYLAEGAPTRQAAPTDSNFDWEGYLGAQAGAKPVAAAGPQWGAWQQFVSGNELGLGPRVAALGYAAAHGGRYAEGLETIRGLKQAYESEHPVLAPGLEIAGSIPTVIAANALTPGLPELAATGTAGRIGAGAIMGAEAGALQTPVTGGDLGQNIAVGTGLGAAFPAVNAAGQRLLAPRINPLVAQAAQRASAQGVKLDPEALAIKTSGDVQQIKNFGRALSRTAGGDFEDITPDAMGTLRTGLQTKLNDLASATKINLDKTYYDALDSIEADAKGIPEETKGKAVARAVDMLRKSETAFQEIDGQKYQNLVKRGSSLDSLMNDPNSSVRMYGAKLRDTVEGALERSNPQIASEWANTRQQWKNSLILQQMAEKAQPSGVLNPSDLPAKVRGFYKEYGWEPPNEIAQLAEASKFLPKATAQGGAKAAGGHG